MSKKKKDEVKNEMSESKPEDNPLTKLDDDGRNTYLIAAYQGNLKEVKSIEKEIDDINTINILDSGGNNIFIIACVSGNLALIRYIETQYNKSKDSNYNIYHTNTNGEDAYLTAALNGHLEVLKHLEETYDWNIHVTIKDDKDVFFLAIEKDHVHIVKRFIECKNYNVYKTIIQSKNTYDIFTYAYNKGAINTVKYLENLNDKLRWKMYDGVKSCGSHPLLCAAINGHLECVKYYIENYKDRDIYVHNTSHNNIYFLSASSGYLNILKYLDSIHFKIDDKKNQKNQNIYEYIKDSKHKDMLEYLSKKKLGNKFKLITYNSVDSCPICKEKINSDDTICKCINDHAVHKECYIEYLYENTIESDFKCCYCKEKLLQACFIAI